VKYLFARGHRDLLQTVAQSNVLLAFDYDGTLSPLVRKPTQATMRRVTRRWLREACRLYPCVVISGRARPDVRGRLHGVAIGRVVGNHGAEPMPGGAILRRRVRRWLPVLRARLYGRQGVVIEDKGLSVALHYRQARRRHLARRAVLSAVRALDDVRIVGGKLAVNCLVPNGPDKGLALARERAHFGCKSIIYVGDDETDEDAFRLEPRQRLLSIRVGRTRRSAARYYIHNQMEVDKLLEALVTLRRHSPQTTGLK
jgi:trehalose 6-phosphate phosphatase